MSAEAGEAPGELDVSLRLSLGGGPGGAKRFSLDVAFIARVGITVLFGPSGSGKSTTLAAIAGLLRPDAGHVRLGSDEWFDGGRAIFRAPHERRAGLVFQGLALFPHLTAAGNVAYGMSRGLTSAERRERAGAVLARLRVSHLRDRLPSTFSGGEAQRVALARAFAMDPRVLLLDEPFSALDRRLRDELAAEIRAFSFDKRVPLVHVTHSAAEARALGDRVVLLEGGRVRASGAAAEVLGAVHKASTQAERDEDEP